MLISNSSRVLLAKNMQLLDRVTIEKYGISGKILMENAGRCCVESIRDNYSISEKNILILCGPGNNGGDGFVIARYLAEDSAALDLFFIGGKTTEDASYHYEIARSSGLGEHIHVVDKDGSLLTDNLKKRIDKADLIVDALFGTGLRSAPRGIFKNIIELVNANKKADVFSVDIPSGLYADTGNSDGVVVKADMTVTFGFLKPAHCLEPGRTLSGSVVLADIGIPQLASSEIDDRIKLLLPEDMLNLLPQRKNDVHKGDSGHILIIGGSMEKPGAAVMTAKAAHRAGAGLVTLAAPDEMDFSALYPETMRKMVFSESGEFSFESIDSVLQFAEGKSAIAVGIGMGTGQGVSMLVEALIREIDKPLLLDADALNIVAEKPEILKDAKAEIIMTPHPGEMSRLCRKSVVEILENKLDTAESYSCENDVVLVLKGASTIIAEPGRESAFVPCNRLWINTTGNPGLACGGSGDVLSGIIGAFLANGLLASEAARLGVFMHGLAADYLYEKRGGYGYLPTEIAEILPETSKILKDGNLYK